MRGNIGRSRNETREEDAFGHFMTMRLLTGLLSSAEKPVHKKNCSRASGITMGGKVIYDAQKDNNGVVIIKCILAVGLCIAGIFIPVAAEMDGIAVALFPLGAVGLSVLLLRNI